MSILQTLERSLVPDNEGSIENLTISVRFTNRDTGYCVIRCLESRNEAQAFFAETGRSFIPPTATASKADKNGAVQTVLTRPAPVVSAEGFAGVGDEAYVWRGYGGNQRGVIKFRIARYIGEVNAPSVENAGALAAHVAAMLKPQ